MRKRALKITALLYLLLTAALLCCSCQEKREVTLPTIESYIIQTEPAQNNNIRLGVVAGPYWEMFMETILPLFSPKGYNVELVVYQNYTEPNFALAYGEIDANMFQHYKYLNSFKFEYNLDLAAIAEIPTATMGIYSRLHRSLEELPAGAMIAIPDDSTNLARALAVLSAAGVIYVDSTVDITKVALKDVMKNDKELQIVPLQAELLPMALLNYDLAVINGNYALSSGLSLADALYIETLSDHSYLNVIAVRSGDLSQPFVADLIDVLRSEEFKNKITDVNGKYSGFQYPPNFNIDIN